MDHPSGSSSNQSYGYEEQEDFVEDEELLNFDTAMQDFQHMFPNLSPHQIEDVLKKYDGDVSASINELLFDTNNRISNIIPPSFPLNEEGDRLTVLRRQRIQIQKKLDEYQRLLDKVVDVETARIYEDQQLACLLQFQEINEQIKKEKERQRKTQRLSPGKVCQRRKSDEKEKSTPRSPSISSKPRFSSKSFDEIRVRCPEGPYVEQISTSSGQSDFKLKISSFKKASASRLSRLFSAS